MAMKLTDSAPSWVCVLVGTMCYSINFDQIVHVEPPSQLKVGDTVLSKDGAQGVIRYIENDWAVVVETEKRKTIRYLCDVQLLVGV